MGRIKPSVKKAWIAAFTILSLYLFFIIFCDLFGDNDKGKIVLIERDALRSFFSDGINNSVILINHEALLINLENEELNLYIQSTFSGKNVDKLPGYPKFGHDALLDPLLYPPQNITIKNERVLGKANISHLNGNISYNWKVTITENEAVHALYETFYANSEIIYTGYGYKLLNLEVYRKYQVKDIGDETTFFLDYVLFNNGSQKLQNVTFSIFFPTQEYEGTVMVNITNITVSKGIEYHKSANVDGRGKITRGFTFLAKDMEINPRAKTRINVSIGGCVIDGDAIYPVIKCFYEVKPNTSEQRIWVPTIIEGNKCKVAWKKYYYMCYFVLAGRDVFYL